MSFIKSFQSFEANALNERYNGPIVPVVLVRIWGGEREREIEEEVEEEEEQDGEGRERGREREEDRRQIRGYIKTNTQLIVVQNKAKSEKGEMSHARHTHSHSLT